MEREATLRHSLLVGAALAWIGSISLTVSILTEALDARRGWGLISNMCLALAITLTVVWSQFRIRGIIIEVFNVGMEAGERNSRR